MTQEYQRRHNRQETEIITKTKRHLLSDADREQIEQQEDLLLLGVRARQQKYQHIGKVSAREAVWKISRWLVKEGLV